MMSAEPLISRADLSAAVERALRAEANVERLVATIEDALRMLEAIPAKRKDAVRLLEIRINLRAALEDKPLNPLTDAFPPVPGPEDKP
jgi:hypothetical protein